MERSSRWPGTLVPLLPFLWLAVFFLVPLGIVAKISLSEAALAQPPYRPVFGWENWREAARALGLDTYRALLADDLYWQAALSSLRIATIATVLLAAIGYPIAYAMASAPIRWQPLLVALIVLPFWTSFLVRIYAWMAILKPDGWLNQGLIATGLIAEPLRIINTETAVQIGLVYGYLPFMALPIYAALERLDRSLIEAAADLGCPPARVFWRVTLPLSLPGLVAGSLLCFIPIVGEFVVPDLLGGSDTLMIGRVLWSEFFSNRDWPLASAVAIVMLAILVLPIVAFRQAEMRRLEARR